MGNIERHAVLGNLELAIDDLSPESPTRYNLREAEKAAMNTAELTALIHTCSEDVLAAITAAFLAGCDFDTERKVIDLQKTVSDKELDRTKTKKMKEHLE